MNEHVRLGMMCPTLSKHYFRTGIRTYEHGSGYNDENIKTLEWACQPTLLCVGLSVTAQSQTPRQAQPTQAVADTTQHANGKRPSARRGDSIADDAHSVKDHHSSVFANQNASDNERQ